DLERERDVARHEVHLHRRGLAPDAQREELEPATRVRLARHVLEPATVGVLRRERRPLAPLPPRRLEPDELIDPRLGVAADGKSLDDDGALLLETRAEPPVLLEALAADRGAQVGVAVVVEAGPERRADGAIRRPDRGPLSSPGVEPRVVERAVAGDRLEPKEARPLLARQALEE